MTDPFKPVLYMKLSCPFCLKVAAFLAEAGLWSRLELRAFWPGDEREQGIRDELTPHLETVSFPALQLAPGEFMNESDAIIAHFAGEAGMSPETMPFLRYVVDGPVRRLREQFAEIRHLNARPRDAAA